ncbi:MAG: hypothetical protein Q7V15_13865 [Phenylobacterium sp.]|uniref:hypothetical protein n=1 Tax=Phenylobacterium sp. TaxID=1871053 RepID=UPI002718B134|nr:hypothetical protein [Phenylobacterium sp.]MDO8902430.1 hypothetical protein [Phenylobacterium sp.]MDP2214232.1 hypothetical protein [Phenylobacterium sp.]
MRQGPTGMTAAAVALLALAGSAFAQADPFGALYGPPPGTPPAKDASSGRTGATSVSGAVGRSYVGSESGGRVSLAQLDMMPDMAAPLPVALQGHATRYLANRPKIAIPGYTLAFVHGASASAFAAGAGTQTVQRRTEIATRLVGLTDDMARDLADAAYADLVSQLEAAGFEVVDLATLLASEQVARLARHTEPLGGKGIIDSRATKAWIAYGPRALPPIKGHAFETGMGAIAASGALMTIGRASRDLDAIFITPRLLIDYIDMDSTGQRTYRGSGSVDAELRFGVNPTSHVDFVWGNNSGGAMPGWFSTKGAYTPQPFGILAQTADRSDSIATHNALVSIGFGSIYRQSLVYDAEISPKRYAALSRAAFQGFNAALVSEIRKARGQ